jgi:hypothetical protein
MNRVIATLSPKVEDQEKEDENPEVEELSPAAIPVRCRVTRKAAWAIG